MEPEPSNTGAGNPSEHRKEAVTKVPSKDPKKKDEKKEEDLVICSLWFSISVLIFAVCNLWCLNECGNCYYCFFLVNFDVVNKLFPNLLTVVGRGLGIEAAVGIVRGTSSRFRSWAAKSCSWEYEVTLQFFFLISFFWDFGFVAVDNCDKGEIFFKNPLE